MKKLCLLLLTTVLIISCKQSDKPLTLVYSHKVCYEPMMIAQDIGLFEEEGVAVSVKLVVGGIQAAEALITGSGDIAAMGEAPAIILTEKNKNIKIIGRYGGGEKMHRLITSNEITTPDMLIGKKIGIQKGSSTHGGFLLWATRNNLDLSQITLVPLNPRDMPEALKTKQVDAIAGSEPWPTNTLKFNKENAWELADFSNLGHTFPLVLAVHKKILVNRKEDLVALFYALDNANMIINQDTTAIAEMTAAKIGISAADEEYCINRLFWKMGWNETDINSFNLTAQFLVKFEKIDKLPVIEDIVDTTILEMCGFIE